MNIYITIGGQGTRLKGISPKDKHLLYFKNKRIIDWIIDIFPNAKTIGDKKTNSRRETLTLIPENNNILIIDCDIIPFGLDLSSIDTSGDCVVLFKSDYSKYSSVILDDNNKIYTSNENNNISSIKCSGVYFLKDLQTTLGKMNNDNSIVSGMVGASTIFENTFLRFGDIEDYFLSIKQI